MVTVVKAGPYRYRFAIDGEADWQSWETKSAAYAAGRLEFIRRNGDRYAKARARTRCKLTLLRRMTLDDMVLLGDVLSAIRELMLWTDTETLEGLLDLQETFTASAA